jgi:hypothetical protein
MFLIDFGDFLNSHLYFVLTLQNRKPYFCVFFSFRDLLDVKHIQSFWNLIFQANRPDEKKKSTWRATRGKIGPTMQSHFLAAWWGPSPTSWALFWISSPLQIRLDVKLTIYMTPPAISRWGNKETHNIWKGYENYKDTRADDVGAAPSFHFASIDTISFTTMIKMK